MKVYKPTAADTKILAMTKALDLTGDMHKDGLQIFIALLPVIVTFAYLAFSIIKQKKNTTKKG